MRKMNIILGLVALMSVALIGCSKEDDDKPRHPSDSIIDEDFKQFLLEKFDVNKDGRLDTIEVNAVREIDCSDKPRTFTSFSGIGIFPYLEKLTLGQISGVDRLGISKNTKLKELYLYIPLSELDVSNNTDLEVLDLRMLSNNLDVSKNTKLKTLIIQFFPSTTFDITNNVNLETLIIHSARFESIDLSKNTRLKKLFLIETLINDIDLSNNTELTEFHYVNFFNTLKKLDITKNTQLEVLDCRGISSATINISKNIALKRLELQGSISHIDISQQYDLEYFDFSSTQIGNDIDIRYTKIDTVLCNSIISSFNANGNKTLKLISLPIAIPWIDLSESTVEEVKILGMAPNPKPSTLLMNNCANLKKFEYGNTNYIGFGYLTIEAENCLSLASFSADALTNLKITNCPALKSVYCYGLLETLDLYGNANIETISCQTSNALKTIDIRSCEKLKNLNLMGLFETIDLSGNPNLERITLYSENLQLTELRGFQKLKYLEAPLCTNGKEINIKDNPVLDTIIGSLSYYFHTPFALNLSNLPELKTLTINSQRLEALKISDCQKLKEINTGQLSERKSLKIFEITNCPVITKITHTNSELSELDLSECPNIETLIVSLNQLTSLQLRENVSYLDCVGNRLKSLELGENSKLRYLNCSTNQLDTLSLENCSGLVYLDCSNNRLKMLDIYKNRALDHLVCDKNTLLTDLIVYARQSFILLQVDSHTKITYKE